MSYTQAVGKKRYTTANSYRQAVGHKRYTTAKSYTQAMGKNRCTTAMSCTQGMVHGRGLPLPIIPPQDQKPMVSRTAMASFFLFLFPDSSFLSWTRFSSNSIQRIRANGRHRNPKKQCFSFVFQSFWDTLHTASVQDEPPENDDPEQSEKCHGKTSQGGGI